MAKSGCLGIDNMFILLKKLWYLVVYKEVHNEVGWGKKYFGESAPGYCVGKCPVCSRSAFTNMMPRPWICDCGARLRWKNERIRMPR